MSEKNKLMKIYEEKIQKIQEIMKSSPLVKEKNLNIKAMNDLPEIRQIINEMREAGITKDWLQSNGMIVASIMLDI
jgi:cell fate (sporulation/competence/biofilm development) regulator YmcA (YheA/YmcA/DUF963 family)